MSDPREWDIVNRLLSTSHQSTPYIWCGFFVVMQAFSSAKMRVHKLPGMIVKRVPVSLNPRFVPVKATTTDLPSNRESSNSKSPNWDIRLLYDGECPLCLKEISMLKRKDTRNKISFVDIATPDYEPVDNGGITYGQAMGRIHGVLPDGRVIKGIEVFRRCYDAVGLGWVYAMTALKPIERLANVVYDIWARYRLPLTGRRSEGIDRMTYWNEAPNTCNGEEYCELTWDEESEEKSENKD